MFKKIAIAASVFLTSPAVAADMCRAVALRDTPAAESHESIWREGQSQMVTGPSGDQWCQHGGYCYSSKFLKLINCKIVAGPYGPEFVLVEGKNPAWVIASDKVDDELLAQGVATRAALPAARLYASGHASHRYLSLIRRAVGGDKTAVDTLNNDDALIAGKVR